MTARFPRALILLVLAAFIAGLCAPRPASAYSVLAHEATIDAAWDAGIRPLLLARFPGTSAAALTRARAFAYGGSVIQDLGYYPFGSHFFSNLLHYVRSGDFVETLVRDARDVNEYAFALGALAHYVNDSTGHPEAVNRAVPLAFPKLRRKFGPAVTYAQAPKQHVLVEFSFDVVQAAGGAYLPDAYRQFIGFEVATPLLERAFRETYGLEMADVFGDEERAIRSYRYSVSQIIPALTEAAWRDKHDEIVKLTPGVQRTGFVFVYGRSEYERTYGTDYRKPGIFARFLATLYRLVPKAGSLKALSFKAPSAEAEKLFADSFRHAAARYRAALADVRGGRPSWADVDYDTGRPTAHGEYALADDTYAQLLDRLARRQFATASSALRAKILAFYDRAPAARSSGREERKHGDRVRRQLAALRHP